MVTNGFVERRRKPSGINSGDLLHLLEIAVLLISVGVSFEKFQVTQDQVTEHTQQLNRIEHYLSSRDAHYWEIVKGD
jgi:hypothetical protein